jgi:ribosomal protein S18 acetylase RimI-like enzyme
MNDERAGQAADVNESWLALGNEVIELPGGRAVRNATLPARRDANHVQGVRAGTEAEIDELLRAADGVFAGGPHRAFYLDFRTPPAFEARLQLEGYERQDALIMLLEGELRQAAKPQEIRLCESDVDWAAYEELHEMDWLASNERPGTPNASWNPRVGFLSDRMKSPPVRSWLAYSEGTPAAYFSSWEGPHGVGQVENLFTHPAYRHGGLATALLHHCVADARAHGAGPVVILCDPNDTPKEMYAALGFRPVAVKRAYWRAP